MKKQGKISGFFGEFRDFIAKGNVLDMAVGIIVGSAFTALVTSVVEDLFTPIFGLFLKDMDFSALEFAGFRIGSFINALISFLLIALTVFLIIKGINTVQKRLESLKKAEKEEEAPTTKACPYCLSEIPTAATRCAHCTSELETPEA